jgi:hypothetical protein
MLDNPESFASGLMEMERDGMDGSVSVWMTAWKDAVNRWKGL